MPNLTSIFNIANSALIATQQALSTTAQNVANLNTPGYSRQRPIYAATAPVDGLPGQNGTGVAVVSIERSVDTYLERQLTASYQQLGQYDIFRTALQRIQGIFGDGNNQGIGASLNQFFSSWDDVATAPADVTARAALLSNAQSLAQQFNQAQADLAANRQALDNQVRQFLTEINDRIAQIARLNGDIVAAEARGQNANDLRDQRGQVLNELADRIAVTALEDSSGAVSVFVGRGQVVVAGENTYTLTGVVSTDKGGVLDIGYNSGGSVPVNITTLISGGRIRGLLDARDTTIPDLQESLDRIAASLANEVNQAHRLGYGLDGSTGNDFFNALPVSTDTRSANTGSATIGGGAITAASLLTFHDYEIRFSSATAYSIVDADTGATIKGNYTGTAIAAPTVDAPVSVVTGANDTLTVSVDGTASGTITLSGAASPGLSYTSGAALASEVQSKINADATLSAAGKSVTVIYDTTTSRLVITSNDTTSSSAVDVTGGTARATLGLSAGTSTAASGTYGTPQTFTLDGISVTVNGAPAANDVFEVNSRDGAAASLAVAVTDRNKVAASSALTGIPFDNGVALEMSALKGKSLAALGSATLSQYYGATAATLGSTTQKAVRDFNVQTGLQEQLQAFRSEVSGVSLDEELVRMLQYQRAFEAAARLITLTDQMLEDLMTLKR